MAEERYTGLEPFVAALSERGVGKIVLRHTDEHRPSQGGLTERVQRCELLAYQQSTIFKCVLEDTAVGELAAPLANAGLAVTLISGNIT